MKKSIILIAMIMLSFCINAQDGKGRAPAGEDGLIKCGSELEYWKNFDVKVTSNGYIDDEGRNALIVFHHDTLDIEEHTGFNYIKIGDKVYKISREVQLIDTKPSWPQIFGEQEGGGNIIWLPTNGGVYEPQPQFYYDDLLLRQHPLAIDTLDTISIDSTPSDPDSWCLKVLPHTGDILYWNDKKINKSQAKKPTKKRSKNKQPAAKSKVIKPKPANDYEM